MKQIVAEFSGELGHGYFTYPFEICLPDWLPDSHHLTISP